MDFNSLFQVAMFQLVTARDAPFPIALAAVVAFVVTAVLARLWYGARIAKLKGAITRRDAELAKLRAHAAPAATSSTEGEAVEDASVVRPAVRSDERRAMRLVVNAIDSAELALRSDDGREADRALSSMALALQAVQATFELPVPTMPDLRAGKAYLERIRPALRAGDADEAQRLAGDFLAKANGPPRIPERPARASA